MRNTQGGFSIVEVLVVMVVGSVVMAAAYQTMISQQRGYAYQHAAVSSQNSARTSLDVLASELREVSASGADIIVAGAHAVTIRASRRMGFVCDAGPPQGGSHIDVWELGAQFRVGHSLFVFNGGDPDDPWKPVSVLGTSNAYNSGSCGTWTQTSLSGVAGASFPRRRLQISNATALAEMAVGAPVRSFEEVTYGLMQIDGEWVLGRESPSSAAAALVGPLFSPDEGGLLISYRDAGGATLTPAQASASPGSVRSLEIGIRSRSPAGMIKANTGGDFITERSVVVFLRNNELGLGAP